MSQLTPKGLIGGPILRRSEPRRVCVWIATDVDVTVRGEIYPARLALAAGPWPRGRVDALGEGESSSLRLGDNLYITLVEIRPTERKVRDPRLRGNAQPDAFPTDELLAYDLAIRKRGASPREEKRLAAFFVKKDAKESSINDPDTGIAYGKARLPTFYLPSGDPNKGQPNILYGSCRKLHGEGGDAFGFADIVLEQNAAIPGHDGKSTNLEKRPSALFLMGDQIYADDVALPLLYHLMQRDLWLIGHHELVPMPDGRPVPRKPGSFSIWIEPLKALLTSDDDARWRHLLTFGEFAAMYLLAWHPVHWKKWEDSLPEGVAVAPTVREILKTAEAEVPSIRRALANVPTYMIFDDHEVTDDWNFTEAWQAKVQEKSPLGRRLVTNALAAYWAFQAWGNDPDQFEDLKEIVPRWLASERADDRVAMETALLRRRPWSFVAPTWPQAIFLDTRTCRDLSPKPGARRPSTQSPRLLDDEAMERFKQAADVQSITKDAILLVVAPAPIFNVRFTELTQEDVATLFGRELPDLELWMDNPGGYIDMVRALAHSLAKVCVILSGDVHYMFAQRADLFENGVPASPPFLQFTSSALQNRHTRARIGFLQSHNATVANLALLPHIPKVEDVHSEHQGLRLKIEMLPATAALDRPGAPGYAEAMFGESNIGQFEIADGIIKSTFWRRRPEESRKPGARPDPDSPVIRVRYR